MLLLIDNYDSFVYNLARYFEELGVEVERSERLIVGVGAQATGHDHPKGVHDLWRHKAISQLSAERVLLSL